MPSAPVQKAPAGGAATPVLLYGWAEASPGRFSRCAEWRSQWSAFLPLDQSPGARQQPVPHRPEQSVLPGRSASPLRGRAGPEDHRRHHWLPGLLQGLPGQEVSCWDPPAPFTCAAETVETAVVGGLWGL